MSSHEAAQNAQRQRLARGYCACPGTINSRSIRDTLTQRGHKHQGLHISHCCRECFTEWDCQGSAEPQHGWSTDPARSHESVTALREKARLSANGARTMLHHSTPHLWNHMHLHIFMWLQEFEAKTALQTWNHMHDSPLHPVSSPSSGLRWCNGCRSPSPRRG